MALVREKISQFFKNSRKTLSLMPLDNQKMLGLSVTLGLVVSLPLLTLALTSQSYNTKRASASGEPFPTETPTPFPVTVFQDNFDSPSSLLNWKWSGSVGNGVDFANVTVASNQLQFYVPKGNEATKPGKFSIGAPGKSVSAQLAINGKFTNFPANFDVSIDLNSFAVDKNSANSAYQELTFGRSLAIRRVKTTTTQALELRTTSDINNSIQDFDKVLTTLPVSISIQNIRVRMLNTSNTIYTYYNLGTAEVLLATFTIPENTLDRNINLVSQNLEPKYPQFYSYYDNFYLAGQIVSY